jgi:8-oxo-dGTP diphosphatase
VSGEQDIRIVVGAVVVREGRVLILQRKFDDFMGGMWEIPSGRCEPGESEATALERELLEETGLQLRSTRAVLGSFEYSSRGGTLTRQTSYLVESGPGDIRLSEHAGHRWITPEEVGHSGLSKETTDVVRRAFVALRRG